MSVAASGSSEHSCLNLQHHQSQQKHLQAEKLNMPLDQLLTEMRERKKKKIIIFIIVLMQGTKVQITVSALLDSVQMQSSKQSLKHFHMPGTDLFLNCLQLSEAFE